MDRVSASFLAGDFLDHLGLELIIPEATAGSRVVAIPTHGAGHSWIGGAFDSLEDVLSLHQNLLLLLLGSDAVEIGVHQSLFGRESLLGIHLEQAL